MTLYVYLRKAFFAIHLITLFHYFQFVHVSWADQEFLKGGRRVCSPRRTKMCEVMKLGKNVLHCQCSILRVWKDCVNFFGTAPESGPVFPYTQISGLLPFFLGAYLWYMHVNNKNKVYSKKTQKKIYSGLHNNSCKYHIQLFQHFCKFVSLIQEGK